MRKAQIGRNGVLVAVVAVIAFYTSTRLAAQQKAMPAEQTGTVANVPLERPHKRPPVKRSGPVTVSITPTLVTLAPGASQLFAATVTSLANKSVSWSVVEEGGGTVTQNGLYTAPSLPGTFTVKAVSQADPNKWADVTVTVVIPVGHPAGYEVGVDYHATGEDFQHTAFIMIYDQPGVRDTVRQQLQGIADRGGTIIFTRLWMVTPPGYTDFGESWRTHFPLSEQETANLRTYAQDVAAIRGAAGNRLRLWICLLWLGASDYTIGSPDTGLGFFNLSTAEYTSGVKTTVTRVLNAVEGITRPDGVPVADRIYINGELMIGQKANEDWFMTTHYPWFVDQVRAAGLEPTVYLIVADSQAALLDNYYYDWMYPILNNHRSMYWTYRSLKFMVDNGLPVPSRIDFSFYVMDSTGAPFDAILARVLDDADAVLPSLGAPHSYFLAESWYPQDATERRALGQAIAAQAVQDASRLRGVCFWTTPNGGNNGINIAYPFAIEDYFPPAETRAQPRRPR